MEDSVVLITGAGSLGRSLTRSLLNTGVKVVRVMDVSEYALHRLKMQCGDGKVRVLLGDVRDRDRVRLALNGVDYVFHTAAVKHVDMAEYNVQHTVDVNVNGLMNLVLETLESEAQKFLFTSSDKAVKPVSLYGLTKAIGEKIVKWASSISEKSFSTIRLPNLVPSDGCVFEVWDEQLSRGGRVSLTDERMERWMIHIDEAADLCVKAIEIAKGGETFIPATARKVRIADLARQLCLEYDIVGTRPGERLVEELMDDWEKELAVLEGGLWVVRQRL